MLWIDLKLKLSRNSKQQKFIVVLFDISLLLEIVFYWKSMQSYAEASSKRKADLAEEQANILHLSVLHSLFPPQLTNAQRFSPLLCQLQMTEKEIQSGTTQGNCARWINHFKSATNQSRAQIRNNEKWDFADKKTAWNCVTYSHEIRKWREIYKAQLFFVYHQTTTAKSSP